MSEHIDLLKRFELRDVKDSQYRDCPSVIQEAVKGNPPRAIERSWSDLIEAGWPHLLTLGGMLMFGVQSVLRLLRIDAMPAWLLLLMFVPIVVLPPLAIIIRRHSNAEFDKLLIHFKAYPNVFRDEVYKLAVSKLPLVDFQGRYRGSDPEAKIGLHETDLLAMLKSYGIEVETSLANRGRPYVVHQYELVELGWPKHENGESGNYTLDLAILWPERRIKFDIEVDGASHASQEKRRKDEWRDKVLTDRGWFVRRFKHGLFQNDAWVRQAIEEVVTTVFYFGKYADDKPLGIEDQWWDARIQNKRLRKLHARSKLKKGTAEFTPRTQPSKTSSSR